jgi:hypothetical protein
MRRADKEVLIRHFHNLLIFTLHYYFCIALLIVCSTSRICLTTLLVYRSQRSTSHIIMSPIAGNGHGASSTSSSEEQHNSDVNATMEPPETSSSNSNNSNEEETTTPKVEIRNDNETRHAGEDSSENHESEEGSDPVVVSPVSSTDQGVFVDHDEKETQIQHKQLLFLPKIIQTQMQTQTDMPPSFWQAGVTKKASPYALQSWSALALTLDGRDKITKVLQYSSRFLGWWFAAGSNNGNNGHSQRFLNLYKSLSTSRKAFRLGRSFIELEKLRSMGLVGFFLWHLQSQIDGTSSGGDDDDGEFQGEQQQEPPKTFVRKASSNIGWGPPAMTSTTTTTLAFDDDDDDEQQEQKSSRRALTPLLYRSLSSLAYRRMYRPLMSKISQTLGTTSGEKPTTELWKTIGSAVKLMALLGFWAGDNVNFLVSSGALDDYNYSNFSRLANRAKWQTVASTRANQAYFAGGLAGLFVNYKSYVSFKREKWARAKERLMEATSKQQQEESSSSSAPPEYQERAKQEWTKVQEQHMTLFLALLKVCVCVCLLWSLVLFLLLFFICKFTHLTSLTSFCCCFPHVPLVLFQKSCCDVMVFSNNPGIDLHKKWRGKKNNEGIHCLLGLISAGTVLYNNFPDSK